MFVMDRLSYFTGLGDNLLIISVSHFSSPRAVLEGRLKVINRGGVQSSTLFLFKLCLIFFSLLCRSWSRGDTCVLFYFVFFILHVSYPSCHGLCRGLCCCLNLGELGLCGWLERARERSSLYYLSDHFLLLSMSKKVHMYKFEGAVLTFKCIIACIWF